MKVRRDPVTGKPMWTDAQAKQLDLESDKELHEVTMDKNIMAKLMPNPRNLYVGQSVPNSEASSDADLLKTSTELWKGMRDPKLNKTIKNFKSWDELGKYKDSSKSRREALNKVNAETDKIMRGLEKPDEVAPFANLRDVLQNSGNQKELDIALPMPKGYQYRSLDDKNAEQRAQQEEDENWNQYFAKEQAKEDAKAAQIAKDEQWSRDQLAKDRKRLGIK